MHGGSKCGCVGGVDVEVGAGGWWAVLVCMCVCIFVGVYWCARVCW